MLFHFYHNNLSYELRIDLSGWAKSAFRGALRGDQARLRMEMSWRWEKGDSRFRNGCNICSQWSIKPELSRTLQEERTQKERERGRKLRQGTSSYEVIKLVYIWVVVLYSVCPHHALLSYPLCLTEEMFIYLSVKIWNERIPLLKELLDTL